MRPSRVLIAVTGLRYALCTAWVCTFTPPLLAQIERPYELTILDEEALEAYYDGDFEECQRQLNKGLAWTKDKRNQQILAQQGYDHTLITAYHHMLGARLFKQLGNPSDYHLKAAESLLKKRRPELIRTGNSSTAASNWLLEAELLFLEGDQYRPLMYNMTFDDKGEIQAPFLRFAGKESLGLFRKDLGKSNWKLASKRYLDAQEILQRHLRIAFNENKNKVAEPWATAHSLQLRLYVAQGHTALLNDEEPLNARLRDAEAWYQRARELHAENGRWNLVKAPSSDYPLSYQAFMGSSVAQNAAQGGNGANGNGNAGDGGSGGMGGSSSTSMRSGNPSQGEGGGSDNAEADSDNADAELGGDDFDESGADLTEAERVWLKGQWSSAMFDWFLLKLLRGEVEAVDVEASGLQARDTRVADPAERSLKQIAFVMQSQMRNLNHPMPVYATHILGSWMTRKVVAKNLSEIAADEYPAMQSLCRDAIVYLRKARMSGRLLRPQLIDSHISELLVLETLSNLEQAKPHLTDEQKDEVREAIKQNHLELDAIRTQED